MNKTHHFFFKTLSYTFLANIISLTISAIAILIIPRKLGVEEYGYFQLYLFYSSYVGFFHLGWSDGVYLRYGGEKYRDIDKVLVRTQFLVITIFSLIIASIAWIIISQFDYEKEKIMMLNFVIICTIIIIPRSFIWLLLQAVGEIIDYAKYTITEKITYIILVLSLLFFEVSDYKFLVVADLLGKGVSFIYTCYGYHEIILGRIGKFLEVFQDIKENILAGSKLMMANIASMLIIGIIRLGIEKNWGITIFSKISFTLSICNFLLVFINAIGMVLFPILKKYSDMQLKEIYKIMEISVSCILFLLLATYYPIKILLLIWLPQYKESLLFMMFLFPICIFESKISLIYNTYLKILRQENLIMQINVYIVILSMVITFINIKIFNNLNWMVISILSLLCLRYILSQIKVARIMNVSFFKTMILDILFSITFILISYFIQNEIKAMFVYGIFVSIYFYFERKNISSYWNLYIKGR